MNCMLSYVCLLCAVTALHSLNIALHAQLHPSAEKVVGSVITTNGLRSAFLRRCDVDRVEIFYPFRYEGFLDHHWDILLIEGWFPSIYNFLALARANFPKCTIIFICLDPTYPGIEIVSKFAVDAIVTNSKHLLTYFEPTFPTEHMLLAADSKLMRPDHEVSRDWGAIFVGAGGHMLKIKPELRGLLLSAIPYGLRLHGSNWENSPEFKDVAMGTLPELELSPAYSSAHVVLAATIQSQSEHHMVNNRIFEALSCGAVVVAQYKQELHDLGCEALLLIDDNHSFEYHMDNVISNSTYATELRRTAREFVLQRHTWEHRTVQLLDFYHQLQQREQNLRDASVQSDLTDSSNICGEVRCRGENCPTLLWLVSPDLQYHLDYAFVGRSIASKYLCLMFEITTISPRVAFTANYRNALRGFDVILAFVIPFDALDRSMQSIGELSKVDPIPERFPLLQKRIGYILGYDPVLIEDVVSAGSSLTLSHYDALWYRSSYELNLLTQVGVQLPTESRQQLMFGLGEETSTIPKVAGIHHVVVICFFEHASSCSYSGRERMLRKVNETYFTDNKVVDVDIDTDVDEAGATARSRRNRQVVLLLLGGSWDAWLQVSGGDDGEPVVHHANLAHTVHVRAGGMSNNAVALLQNAQVVVIMTAPPSSRQSNALSSCSSSMDVLQCHIDHQAATVRDTLWPVVAAAVAGRWIHLQHIPAQIAYLVREGQCAGWSSEQFRVMVRTGANRALGLGSRLSAFTARTLQPNNPVEDDDKFLRSFYESNPPTTFTTTVGASASERTSEGVNSGVAMVWLKLNYTHFEVGRDGEACIEQAAIDLASNASSMNVEVGGISADRASGKSRSRASWNTPGERVCLMRPYRYLAIQFFPLTGTKECPTERDELAFFLRGAVFGDPFHSFEISPRELLQSNHIISGIAHLNSSWLSTHRAFVYNAVFCVI